MALKSNFCAGGLRQTKLRKDEHKPPLSWKELFTPASSWWREGSGCEREKILLCVRKPPAPSAPGQGGDLQGLPEDFQKSPRDFQRQLSLWSWTAALTGRSLTSLSSEVWAIPLWFFSDWLKLGTDTNSSMGNQVLHLSQNHENMVDWFKVFALSTEHKSQKIRCTRSIS